MVTKIQKSCGEVQSFSKLERLIFTYLPRLTEAFKLLIFFFYIKNLLTIYDKNQLFVD